MIQTVGLWFEATVLDLFRRMRWSFLPPLMVYFAAGISGLTGIVGVFFVKEYLDLSAVLLTELAFWAGIPWAMKMPLGHLVDLIWRWKAMLVYLGAGLIAASLSIMYMLVAHTTAMAGIMPAGAWFVLSALLSPIGYVVQDVVADAMTVEAIPATDATGAPLPEAEVKAMHTTMQTLGRFAIISGLVAVATLNIVMFADVEAMDEARKVATYSNIYLMALAIPLVSISGVALNRVQLRARAAAMRAEGVAEARIDALLYTSGEATEPNWWIFGGGLAFAVVTLTIGLSGLALAQELVFAGSMIIVGFLMSRLMLELTPENARALIGTALIIFVFRAVPLPGPGATWFEIDMLGFDQQFLSVLSLITSCLTLVGMVLLRPLMATLPLANIVALLTVAAAILSLPNIGLYYGVQDWTARMTAGVVDAHFIAIIDTAVESPLGQIAMIPMLAWIAKNAPPHLKATFFAVMASFTNLALSASSLATKHMNVIFTVSREVKDSATGAITTTADYSQLGVLLILVAVIGLIAPLATIFVVQHSPLRTKA